MYYADQNAMHTGLTNWANVLTEDAREYILGQKPGFRQTFDRLTQLKDLYPTDTSFMFPFSPLLDVSQLYIADNFPSKRIVRALVENYMNTFNKTHRLFHSLSFLEEVAQSWDTQQAPSPTWLAQLLMVMSLSCRTASQQLLAEVASQTMESFEIKCLQWAEVSLSRAPFMTFPDLAAIRVLCLMMVSKSFDVGTPTVPAGLLALEGFVVRLAMSMSLHRDPSTLPFMSPLQAELRRRVWATILFMDLNAAIDSGLPALIKPTDWDTAPPLDIDDFQLAELESTGSFSTSHRHANGVSDSSLQIRLSQAYKVVSLVVSTVNSSAPKMEYEMVLECDNRLRDVLREADDMFTTTPAVSPDDCQSTCMITLQLIMLNVLLRRTLLALHKPYDDDVAGSHRPHATSHWSVLECSLALLNAQNRLHEKQDNLPPLSWFADLYQSDFAVAMLHVIQGLRRGDFADVPGHVSSPDEQQVMPVLGRETTRVALRASFDIVEASVGRSFHSFKIYMGVTLSIAALEAAESGLPLDEKMQDAALRIIETTKKSRTL